MNCHSEQCDSVILPINIWANVQSQSVYDLSQNKSVTILNMVKTGDGGFSLYIRAVVEQKDPNEDYPYEVMRLDDKASIQGVLEINNLGHGSEKEIFMGGKFVPSFLTRFVDRGRHIYRYQILQLSINAINNDTGIINTFRENS